MSIQKVIPVVSKLTRDQIEALEESSENHQAPFGGNLPVSVFKDAALRQTVARYWRPSYRDTWPRPHATERRTVLSEMLRGIPELGIEEFLGRKLDDLDDFPVEVRIVLTYPFQEYWEMDVRVPADQFGAVFGQAYDMYCHIYALDDEDWGEQGHDKAPQLSPKCANRAKGKHVWGHDMSDLVFEGLGFSPASDWPTEVKKEMVVMEVNSVDEMVNPGEPPPPKTIPVPMAVKKERHADACPFLGTITFHIGS